MPPKGRPRGSKNKAKPTSTKRTGRRRGAYTPATSDRRIIAIVNRLMSKKIEDKFSSVEGVDNQPLLRVTAASGAMLQFQQSLSELGFEIPQGVEQDQRIGNEITMKSWVIKVAITPTLPGEGINFITSPQLYVNFYVGYRKDYAQFTNPITGFFQNGNSSQSPSGEIFDRISFINKDVYTIVYKRQFKLGLSAPMTEYTLQGLANNDFSLTALFKFDMCEHGFKNHKLKYNDSALAPQDAKLAALTMFTIITNANGENIQNLTPGFSTYDISISSQFKYEDA